MLKLIIFSTLYILVHSEKIRYDNYCLYKVHPENDDHVKYLNQLYKESDGLDFWLAPSGAGEDVSVVSTPEKKNDFEHSLRKRSINYSVMLQNIQEALDNQVLGRRKRDASGQMFWTNYQTMEDIYDWFNYLARNHSDVVSLIYAGKSFEGRNITGVKISRGSGIKKKFFIEGGQVAADWLSPTVITYLVDQLVKGEDAEARAVTEDFEWHIFPITNPDGHEYSQDAIRLWMKNRRPSRGSSVGVDLTRNWNSQWGVSGASFNPETNTYVGLGPFSEPETRAVSNYIESISTDLSGLLSLRSFGQRLIIPFAHTDVPMHNFQEMIIVGRRAMGSLAVKYNTQYRVGNSRQVFDGATGVIADWAKFRFNPPIVATFALRDEGSWGYTLPVEQVKPTCEETYDGILAIVREAKHLNIL